MHGLLFLFPLRAPAEKKYFLATRNWTPAHLQAFPHVLPIFGAQSSLANFFSAPFGVPTM
jgi:hypothetical protein